MAILDAWRDAVAAPAARRGEPPIEPWDWWWRAGEADRALNAALPLNRVFEINRRVHEALGARLDALGIRFDTVPRPGRPPLPVAFTTFGARPHARADGSWDPGEPTVFANYVDGGLGDLNELVHETGHAIHIAAIRTRPAFADWPDSDALTEALAELVTLDVGEPAWNARWIDGAPGIPAATATRCRYAQVALDAAWTLFEIRLHDDPERVPNDVWTEITAEALGVAPHPDWSWWAMRGQLVQEPGYMANYAVGCRPRGRPPGGDPRRARRLDRRRPRLVRVGDGPRLPVRAGALRGRRAAGRARAPTERGGGPRRHRPGAPNGVGQRIQSGGRFRRRRIRM